MSTFNLLTNSQWLLVFVLQASLLSGLGLAFIKIVKPGPVLRYSVAWTTLLALPLLGIVSIASNSLAQGLSPFALNIPVDRFLELDVTELGKRGDVAFTTEAIRPAELDLPLAQGPDADTTVAASPTPTFTIDQLIKAVALIWLAGIVMGLLRLVRAAVHSQRVRKQARAANRDELRRLHSLLSALSLPDVQTPDFIVSNRLQTPALLGVARPVVAFPASVLKRASDEQLQAILLHELAHWQRRDNLGFIFQSLVVVLLWFHPFVLGLNAIANRSREEICDNHVLAYQDGINYSETLLWIGSLQSQQPRTAALQMSMVDKVWKLEERIHGLIDGKRGIAMNISNTLSNSIRIALVAASIFLASAIVIPPSSEVTAQDNQDAQNAPRPAPAARYAETLSDPVFTAITQIQELMTTPDVESEDFAEAKRQLDALYDASFEAANGFEQSTILNFYTNYYLRLRDYPMALETFEQIMTVDDLRPDIELRTLRSLGQLYAQQEQWQDSVDAFAQWREQSDEEDALVFRGLSYGQYKLGNVEPARDYWLQYLQEKPAEEVTRDDLAYLNGLHFQLDDYASSLALTKEMILRFNNDTDWDNLQALYQSIEEAESGIELDPELGSTLDFSTPEPEIVFANVIPTDGDYLPLLATAPMYPSRAAEEGIEGWVQVEFTVTEQGTVDTDSITVLDFEPSDVFNANSIRAASKFVFSPRMESGEPVPVEGVQYLFRFRLSQGEDDA